MIIVDDVMCVYWIELRVRWVFSYVFFSSFVQVLCQKRVFRDNAVAGWETLAEGIDRLQ